ncbi:hypothetical protein D3C72_1501110 [compost metagenome]
MPVRQRTGTHRRLRHQPLPRRHFAAHTRHRVAGAADGQTRAGRAALSARPVPRRGRRRRSDAGRTRRLQGGGAATAAYQQSHGLRRAARPPRYRPAIHPAGAADSSGRPGDPAWQQEHARRPGLAATARLARLPGKTPALRRQGARHLRRLPDAGTKRVRSAGRGRRGGRVKGTGLARHGDGADKRQAAGTGERPLRVCRRGRCARGRL